MSSTIGVASTTITTSKYASTVIGCSEGAEALSDMIPRFGNRGTDGRRSVDERYTKESLRAEVVRQPSRRRCQGQVSWKLPAELVADPRGWGQPEVKSSVVGVRLACRRGTFARQPRPRVVIAPWKRGLG